MFQNNTEWPLDKVQRLRELAAEGRSASVIGVALGVSRSAVIGKAQRCNIRIDSRSGGYAKREPAPPPIQNFWTEEKVGLLRRIASDARCWSAAAIGAMLGTSRSSVIKKCERAGVTLGRTKGMNGAARYATEAEALSMGVTLPPGAPVGKPRDRTPPRRPRVKSVPLAAAHAYSSGDVEPINDIFSVVSGGVPIWDLRNHHCRAITHGDASDIHTMRYCGETVANAMFMFCAGHCARYLQTPSQARAERRADRQERVKA
jgi:hypothetical protein